MQGCASLPCKGATAAGAFFHSGTYGNRRYALHNEGVQGFHCCAIGPQRSPLDPRRATHPLPVASPSALLSWWFCPQHGMTTPFLRGRRAKDSPIFELRTSARSHRQSFALRRKRLGEELNEVELTFKECAALQEATVEPTIRVELVQGTKKGKAGSLFSHSHAMTLLPLASQSDLLSASLGGLRCEGTQSLPRTTTLCIVAFPFRLLPSLLRWQSYLLRRSCGAKQKD